MKCYLNDITITMDILDNLKETRYEIPDNPIGDSDLLYLIRKRQAIDQLAEYIKKRAYDAPIITLIEDFIYKNTVNAAQCKRDSEAYDFFRLLKETAEEAAVYFQ